MHVPTTSTTLLREIGSDADSPRWDEFVARYRPMMEAFLSARFPSLSAEGDDIVQETLVALVRALPGYRHDPEEKGAFHNFLTGVLRHKAAMAARRRAAAAVLEEKAAAEPREPTPAADEEVSERDEAAWRDAVREIALRQFLADDSVQERTRQVFVRLAVLGQPAEKVAADFGISANAAAQMKSRGMAKLRRIVEALSGVRDA